MGIIWKIMKVLLFRMDAERVHHLACLSLRALGPLIRRVPPLPKRTQVFGLSFLNPVGLAAGFDKGAHLVDLLPSLGFGFVEIGTVTPRPQPGNPLPRLFRRPGEHALFNRMGFNSEGAEVVSERLRRARRRLPKDFRVGVNIGKNKDTSLEQAGEDYLLALAPFRNLADYVVINVSSPNTPGLRELQTVQALQGIVDSVLGELEQWSPKPPLLVKLAPEIFSEESQARELIQQLHGVDGWVLTNTLGGEAFGAPGGWSGAPLKDLSLNALKRCKEWTGAPIVSVGGIMSTQDAKERFEAGAGLVQVYSGWIYGGPGFARRLVKG